MNGYNAFNQNIPKTVHRIVFLSNTHHIRPRHPNMPNYEVEHICPLTEGQKDELASAITKIHSEQFSTPKIFVNIRFTNVEGHATYVAGKRVRHFHKQSNIILLHNT